nr:hypothetical protein CFP56_30788 [Quercus suber]
MHHCGDERSATALQTHLACSSRRRRHKAVRPLAQVAYKRWICTCKIACGLRYVQQAAEQCKKYIDREFVTGEIARYFRDTITRALPS